MCIRDRICSRSARANRFSEILPMLPSFMELPSICPSTAPVSYTHLFMTCADFIVSTPDYFRYNPADEFITPEQIEEIAANTKSSLSGTGYAVRKPVYLWMTEDALRQDYARYESAEQLDSHMSRMEHRLSLIHI